MTSEFVLSGRGSGDRQTMNLSKDTIGTESGTQPQVLIEAAGRALAMVPGSEFERMVRYTLDLLGGELAQHVTEDDEGWVLVPVVIREGAKELNGALLALKDRAVISWLTGTFKIKRHSSTLRYASVREVTPVTAAGQTVLEVAAERDWRIRIPLDEDHGGVRIDRVVGGVLDGHITFESKADGGFSLNADPSFLEGFESEV